MLNPEENEQQSKVRYAYNIPSDISNTWISGSYFNSYNNSYTDIEVSLKPILDYPISYINEKINAIKRNVKIIPVDYDNIYSYVTSYSTELLSYYMGNLSQNLGKIIKDTVGHSSNNSITRNSSKKISELRGRGEITKHKDHSWIPLAQYDSRINSYHNIAMNVASITSYCTDYSDDMTSYTFEKISYEYKDLKELQDLASGSYINNSYIAGNIISYSFAYSKDYFEWLILP